MFFPLMMNTILTYTLLTLSLANQLSVEKMLQRFHLILKISALNNAKLLLYSQFVLNYLSHFVSLEWLALLAPLEPRTTSIG